MLDVDEVKRAAAGRWASIIPAVTLIPADILDGQHHACPKCGGKDRFRAFKDFKETGGVYCNGCLPSDNGNGIAVVKHFAGVDYPTALRIVADYLGMTNGNGRAHKAAGNGRAPARAKKAASPATLAKGIEPIKSTQIHETLLAIYAKAKPPITPEGVRKCGGSVVRWYGQPSIRLDGRAPIDSPIPTAVVLLRPDGKPFPAAGKIGERKTHTTKGSVNSWIASGDVAAAETIIDVEGITDWLAVVSAGLPPGYAAVTNTAGAKARGALARPWAAGKKIIVAGDADEPGVDGQHQGAAAYHQAGAAQVLLAQLPYAVERDHGRDLRDWLLEGHAVADLPAVAVTAAQASDWAKAKPTKKSKADTAASAREQFTLTDTGLAERFAEQHCGDVRYCYPWQKWLAWDDTRWSLDATGAIEQKAKQTARSIYQEAADEEDSDRREALGRFARQSESAAKRAAMAQLARSEPGIPILPDTLDQDDYLLNGPNGTIELRTGTLREHRPSDFITKLCPIPFHPAAECPLWLACLQRIFDGRQSLITFVQRLFGYCLTGDVSEQVLPIFYGVGANGKSTILGIIMEMLGADYAMKGVRDLLMVKRQEGHSTDRADLFGKRLVVCIETEERRRLAEALVKDLTGSDRQRARKLYQDNFEFSPTHKIVLAVNHKPTITGTDHAIWRRVKLVPFNVIIPLGERDKAMPTKLRAELPGILAWCVRGCLDWQRDGLGAPEEVAAATSDYAIEQDTLSRFLEESCIIADDARAKASELLAVYREWTGDKRITQRDFGGALTERGFARFTNNGTWYKGLGLPSDL
jgi:putative DNA primase/helicase